MSDLFRAVCFFPLGMCVSSSCFVAGTQWIILGTATPRAREREVCHSCVLRILHWKHKILLGFFPQHII